MPTLNWIGKEAVINHHHDVPFKTLDKKYTFVNGKTIIDNGRDAVHTLNNGRDAKSCINDGKDAKSCVNDGRDAKSCVSTTENKIIHGDNLEALKALLPEYEGKIKCIYIDPPYNTGNENWVYNDNVNSPRIRKWLGQVVGKEAEDLTRHDKWLCMMYPRLKLLHQLLSDDGAIFISIDDNEQANLKLICDEIFGSGNFVAEMPRITKKSGKSTDVIAKNNDYVLVYSKSYDCELMPFEHNDANFKNKDEYFEERGFYKLNQTLDYDSLQYSPSLDYPLEIDGVIYYPGGDLEKYNKRKSGVYKRADWAWRWSKEKFKFGYENGFIVVKTTKNGTRIYTKTYQKAIIEECNKEYKIIFKQRTAPISTIKLVENEFSNDNATKVLTNILGEKIFDYAKPNSLVEFLIKFSTDKSSIILDSFAGSGTTAHAVLNLNKQDGGNRKFILVEMEDYAETITAERVRRVINGYGRRDAKSCVSTEGTCVSTEGTCVSTEGTGGAFTYYELGEPIMNGDYLNENQPIEKIREYIWYTETCVPYCRRDAKFCVSTGTGKSDTHIPTGNPYHLGNHNNAGYYFYYEKNTTTTLDKAFLNTISQPADQYIIYADNCLLSDEFMRLNNIVFKKIPRDIRKF